MCPEVPELLLLTDNGLQIIVRQFDSLVSFDVVSSLRMDDGER
jgi:hypothetical protein